MKRISFLQAGFLGVLMVLAASCSLPMGAGGNSYEETPPRSNRYYGNELYGGPNTIIVERDPYTGQYYQVTPGLYNNRFGTRTYQNRGRIYQNNDRRYNPRGTVRKNYPPQTPRSQTPEQQQQKAREREQAKDAILGKKHN